MMQRWTDSYEDFHKTHPSIAGRLYAFACAITGSLHILVIRQFRRTVDPVQITQGEMMWAFILANIYATVIKAPLLHPKESKAANLLLIRCCFAIPGFTSAVVGQYLLPSQIFIVMNNSNMIFAILFAIILVKQYPRPLVVVGVATFIFGVALMLCPWVFGLG